MESVSFLNVLFSTTKTILFSWYFLPVVLFWFVSLILFYFFKKEKIDLMVFVLKFIKGFKKLIGTVFIFFRRYFSYRNMSYDEKIKKQHDDMLGVTKAMENIPEYVKDFAEELENMNSSGEMRIDAAQALFLAQNPQYKLISSEDGKVNLVSYERFVKLQEEAVIANEKLLPPKENAKGGKSSIIEELEDGSKKVTTPDGYQIIKNGVIVDAMNNEDAQKESRTLQSANSSSRDQSELKKIKNKMAELEESNIKRVENENSKEIKESMMNAEPPIDIPDENVHQAYLDDIESILEEAELGEEMQDGKELSSNVQKEIEVSEEPLIAKESLSVEIPDRIKSIEPVSFAYTYSTLARFLKHTFLLPTPGRSEQEVLTDFFTLLFKWGNEIDGKPIHFFVEKTEQLYIDAFYFSHMISMMIEEDKDRARFIDYLRSDVFLNVDRMRIVLDAIDSRCDDVFEEKIVGSSKFSKKMHFIFHMCIEYKEEIFRSLFISFNIHGKYKNIFSEISGFQKSKEILIKEIAFGNTQAKKFELDAVKNNIAFTTIDMKSFDLKASTAKIIESNNKIVGSSEVVCEETEKPIPF